MDGNSFTSRKVMSVGKKRLLIALGIFIALGVLLSIGVYFSNSTKKNMYGDEIVITNLHEYTKGKSYDQQSVDYIQNDLLKTVNMNQETPIEGNTVTDAIVRDTTFTQDDNKDTSIHTVKFIVDIKSLKQSYDISYQWVDRSDVYGDEWGTNVTCLPLNKLLYGDFSCKDMFILAEGPVDEKLDKILPYTSPFYRIGYFSDGKDFDNPKFTISIQIMQNVNSDSTKKGYKIYQQQAKDWLVSQGVDMSEYSIVYRDLLGDTVTEAQLN